MHVILLATSAILAASSTPTSDTGACAWLKARTQAFSDAGLHNDGAAMASMLDENVIFFNEGGDQATRADMAANTPTPGPSPKVTTTVTDWSCHRFGDTAVAGFIDVRAADGPDGPITARFRSVETWHLASAGWKLIGSQTLALWDDPTPVTLGADELEAYVGEYRSSDGRRFLFAREGDHLVASLSGGPVTPQAAEVRDVFFTPGRSRFRKVFTRDAKGRVNGFLYRSEGRDLRFQKVG